MPLRPDYIQTIINNNMPIIKQNLAAQDYNMYLFMQKNGKKNRGRERKRKGWREVWRKRKVEDNKGGICQFEAMPNSTR